MPLPEQSTFEEFLQSLTPVRPEVPNDLVAAQVLPAASARDEGNLFVEAECNIWYRPCAGLTFDALVTRVQKELAGRGHKKDKSLALCIIAFFALDRRRAEGAVAAFNRLLGTIGECDLSQFFVTPIKCGGKIRTFSLGPFILGPANLTRIEHRSKKAGSDDYFARWRHRLDDHFTIEREVVTIRCIGIPAIRDAIIKDIEWGSTARRLWERGVNAYFHALAIAYAQEFWEAFLSAQHLLIAAGSPYIDERVTRRLTPADMLSIFRNIDGAGFVAPIGQDFSVLEMGGFDTKIPRVIDYLHEQFGFTTFKDTDVHHSLRTFTLFVSKAKRHELDARSGEAFLHYVIALDLLFGEQEGATASVTRRAAVVVCRALGMTLPTTQKLMNRIYDLRSKYVHRGIEMPSEEIATVARVCTEVLFALLRYQQRADQSKTIAAWLKNLDYLNSAIDAGKEISAVEFGALGIAMESSVTVSGAERRGHYGSAIWGQGARARCQRRRPQPLTAMRTY